ncbi:MAG: YdcF family protein [Lachnospiraceae bacterium]|nr:YdcF family protein [Lachnospiraceae bacterium]MBR5944704.1 YdcF family protein [Lachnospiraceae bacterium]
MDKIHLIIKAISLLAIIWFMIPMVGFGIVNIGNATGAGVFLIVFLCDLLRRPLAAILKSIWSFAIGKGILSLLCIAVLTIVVVALIETFFIIKENFNKPEGETTLVVLGCAVYGETPSRILARRVDAAGKFLEENPDVVAILSGGKGEGENISEAECMYRRLVARGIDPDRLYKEDKSVSTRQNLEYSLKIIKEKGLPEQITITTSGFHAYRARMVARDMGLETKSLTCLTPWYALPTYYIRELYGILYQFFHINSF